MRNTAAAIAGVPGRILNDVLAAVREAHPNDLVIRGQGARLYESRRALYLQPYIDTIVAAAGDAVFGQTGRPQGFCRNPQRACLHGAGAGRVNCGQAGVQSCGRTKPERFVLFYQEGEQDEEDRLIDFFRHTAWTIRIPRDCYDNTRLTASFVAAALRTLPKEMSRAVANIKGTSPSLLLPLLNFGKPEARKLVRKAVRGSVERAGLRSFKTQFFKPGQYFEGRARLSFQPTYPAIAHGIPASATDTISSLGAHYRAGCDFGAFHWDVSPVTGGWGATTIECRTAGGRVTPSSTHINLLVDDRIR